METKKQEFANYISNFVNRIPFVTVLRLCNSLDRISPQSLPDDCLSISQDFQPSGVRQEITNLLQRWIYEYPSIRPGELSWALRTAGTTIKQSRSSSSIELVWSGPTPKGVSLRRTEQVLLDLINSASESLLIVTYVVYDIRGITEALLNAIGRGVKIRFILESPSESDGKIKLDTIHALGEDLAKQTSVYIWPLERIFHYRPMILHIISRIK